MSKINYDEFVKKYGIAITGLSKRTNNDNEQLAKKLYRDSLANKVDMNDMTMAITHFYQGNVAGQIKMKNYVDRYKQ